MVYHKEHNKMAENDLSIRSSAAEYLTYIASTGNTDESIEIRYEDENIRLTQKMMAVLYDVEAHTINYHIKKILEDNELNENSTIRKFRIVQTESLFNGGNLSTLERIFGRAQVLEEGFPDARFGIDDVAAADNGERDLPTVP